MFAVGFCRRSRGIKPVQRCVGGAGLRPSTEAEKYGLALSLASYRPKKRRRQQSAFRGTTTVGGVHGLEHIYHMGVWCA